MEALIVTLEFLALWAFLLGSLYLVDKARDHDSIPKAARTVIILCVIAVSLFSGLAIVRASNKRQCNADSRNDFRDLGVLSIGTCGEKD